MYGASRAPRKPHLLYTCLSDYIHAIEKKRDGAWAWLVIYSITLLLCFYSIMNTGDYWGTMQCFAKIIRNYYGYFSIVEFSIIFEVQNLKKIVLMQTFI